MALKFNARTNTLVSDGSPRIVVDQGVVEANVGLTADVGSAQGNGVITSFYNVYSTVANAGDAATLLSTFVAGTVIYFKNDGVNSMDIFPASGDDLGAGSNNPIALPAGESLTFIAIADDATWTELIVPPSTGGGGGGDVTKVGTPADNEIGVWTGDGTIEGDTNFTWDGSTLAVTGDIDLQGSGRPSLLNLNASITVPTLIPHSGDPNTGIGGGASDQLVLVAGGQTSMYLRELSGGTLFANQTSVGLTADANSSQGDAPIINSYNVYSTVVTTGDAATLPAAFLNVGIQVHVKNDGASSMDVFPASGDDLGEGTNVALAVPAGESRSFLATAVDSTWTQINVPASGGGGGDVTKVGTPVDNELGVWTGDGTLEGDANLTWDGTNLALTGTTHIVLPQTDDAATPTLAFGDGDSGFYEVADDTLALSLGAIEVSRFEAGTVQTTDATVTEILAVAVASGESKGFEIHCIGREDATGDTVFVRIFGAIENTGGTTAFVGGLTTDRTDVAGSATWAITVTADDGSDELTVDVTGEAAHTIDWKIRLNEINT